MSSLQTHPKDECFINPLIENYARMKNIFGKRGVANPLAVDMWIMQTSVTPILSGLKSRGRGGYSPTIALTSGGELMLLPHLLMLLCLFCPYIMPPDYVELHKPNATCVYFARRLVLNP